jgi:hypothetical protein
MKTLIVLSIAALLLLPISEGFGQLTNTPSTLGIKLTNTTPFSYKDDQGYTVVIGEVENTRAYPITNVKVWIGFYSGKAAGSGGEPPLEATTGSTILDVIPPNGKSPFMIKSQTANSEISEVTINLLGFTTTSQKQQVLEIKPGTLSIGNTVKLTVEVKNNGQQPSAKTKIHLIAFDTFNPPRIVGIQTTTIDEIAQGKSANVNFDVSMDYRAASFKVIAESDSFQSKFTDVTKITLEAPTRLVSINDVAVQDATGNRTSHIKVGTPVNITSSLSVQYSVLAGSKQPFVYYAQVKQFGENAIVEFLGFTEGIFDSAVPQTVSVNWTPEHDGGFFIEAYVWDPDGVALAPPSKIVSIVLVTP